MSRTICCVLGMLLLVACKTTGNTVPYPAHVVVDELPDMFIAGTSWRPRQAARWRNQ